MGPTPSMKLRDEYLELELNELFHKDAEAARVFENVKGTFLTYPQLSHAIVGARWLQFSETMPKLLSLMILSTDSNSIRCKYVTTLFEELGSGFDTQVHSELYFNALRKSNLGIIEISAAKNQYPLSEIVYVETAIVGSSAAKILGISMGLELIAQENIDHLALAFSNGTKNLAILRDDEFFKIHFQNEISHIRANLDHFRSLATAHEEKEYTEGVKVSLNFWYNFWQNNILQISHHTKIL